jgi:hypothetical protein
MAPERSGTSVALMALMIASRSRTVALSLAVAVAGLLIAAPSHAALFGDPARKAAVREAKQEFKAWVKSGPQSMGFKMARKQQRVGLARIGKAVTHLALGGVFGAALLVKDAVAGSSTLKPLSFGLDRRMTMARTHAVSWSVKGTAGKPNRAGLTRDMVGRWIDAGVIHAPAGWESLPQE